MSDIVERLRNDERWVPNDVEWPWPLMNEAADEIARLRAKIVRLREFVERVSAQKLIIEMDPLDVHHAAFDDAYERMIEDARTALAAGDD